MKRHPCHPLPEYLGLVLLAWREWTQPRPPAKSLQCQDRGNSQWVPLWWEMPHASQTTVEKSALT